MNVIENKNLYFVGVLTFHSGSRSVWYSWMDGFCVPDLSFEIQDWILTNTETRLVGVFGHHANLAHQGSPGRLWDQSLSELRCQLFGISGELDDISATTGDANNQDPQKIIWDPSMYN